MIPERREANQVGPEAAQFITWRKFSPWSGRGNSVRDQQSPCIEDMDRDVQGAESAHRSQCGKDSTAQRTPKICTSSIQLNINQHVQMRKLPTVRRKTTEGIRGNSAQYSQGPSSVPIPNSQSGEP